MVESYVIKDEFTENYNYARDYWAPMIQDAQTYVLASAGYTWTDAERNKFRTEKREPIEFNIMRRPLSFFSGYLRDNINQIIYSPVEGSDDKTADQLTKLSYHIWDKGCGYDIFLNSCDESFKAGICLCGICMDYKNDFVNGDISFFMRTYNSFYLDPSFKDISLRDCSFAIMRDVIDKEYAKQLLPFIDPKEIDDLISGYSDGKFINDHPNFTMLKRKRNLVAYDQYYKMKSQKKKYLIDIDSGFNREIDNLYKEEIERLKVGISRFDTMRNDPEFSENLRDIPNLEIREVDRPFVELNIFLNGELAYTGIDRTRVTDRYPFVPILCYFEPSISTPSLRVQGISAANWSAQRQFNTRHMKILDMMDTVISTGYKYLIGSVKDPSDLQQTGQNRIIGIDPENAPLGMDSVQELRVSGGDPALMEYQKILNDLTLELSNINESTLGADEGGNTQISGRLAQVRIAQGLIGNRKIFDNVEVSQRHLGTIILEAIQKNYPPAKVQRIIAQEPTDQFYDSEFEQYDSVTKEGVRSQSQRDAYYYELVNLKREGIVDVPESEIISALSMAGISDLEEAIKEREEQNKAQKEKIDAQERMAIELENARKEEMIALAQERRARVISDIGLANERASESEENRAQAALARAKTITEIASLKDDRILKVLNFVNMLERQEIADREAVDAEIEAESNRTNEETRSSFEGKQVQENEMQVLSNQETQVS